jgi:hypothetical protein
VRIIDRCWEKEVVWGQLVCSFKMLFVFAWRLTRWVKRVVVLSGARRSSRPSAPHFKKPVIRTVLSNISTVQIPFCGGNYPKLVKFPSFTTLLVLKQFSCSSLQTFIKHATSFLQNELFSIHRPRMVSNSSAPPLRSRSAGSAPSMRQAGFLAVDGVKR